MLNQLANRTFEISPFYVMEILQRAKQLEAQGRTVIHMEIGEPDFPTPQGILSAAAAYLKSGNIKYTSAAGLPALRANIADYYQKHYKISLDPRRIFITPGASGAFLLAMGVSINPGDEILMADPCYPCNSNFVRLFEGKARKLPVDATTQYQLTPELIQQEWLPATKGVLIASPSNPTGTLMKAGTLEQCIATTDNRGGCFYSDEIYHGLVYDQHIPSALNYSDDVFVINSFSKYFGMTGWRIGWLIVPEALIDATEILAQNIFISSPTLSQYAALAAFDESTLDELENRRFEFAERRDFLFTELVKLGFEIPIKPDGAFYIYANCSEFTDDSYLFALNLLESKGIAVTPGKDFGNNVAHQYVRFSYTTSIPRMAEAIKGLNQFINRI